MLADPDPNEYSSGETSPSAGRPLRCSLPAIVATAAAVGPALGGVLVARYGILRALLIAGILQAASNLVFVYLAWVGYSVPVLVVTIGVENITGGMGTTAFVAYLSSLCNRSYTATQYALLSSMMAAARTFFASGAGWVVEQTDWIAFFLISTAAAVPSLLLLWWIMARYADTERER